MKTIKDKLKALEDRRGEKSEEWMKKYEDYRASTSTFGHPSQTKREDTNEKPNRCDNCGWIKKTPAACLCKVWNPPAPP